MSMTYNDFVCFDVIGTKYRFTKETFKHYPSSLFHYLILNVDKKIELPYGVLKVSPNKYFVQRSPDVIQLVVKYCLTNKLHLPKCMCSQDVIDEFHFWHVKFEIKCETCVDSYEIEEEILDQSEEFKRSNSKIVIENTRTKWTKYRSALWTFLEHPHSSTAAMVFNVFSMIIILISLFNILLASLPELQFCPSMTVDDNIEHHHEPQNATKDLEAALFVAEDDFEWTECTGTRTFHIIDIFCMSWFTLEVVLRFISCPTMKKFFTTPLHIIDILAVLPFYIELILWATNAEHNNMNKARVVLMFLRILRIVRVFRIVKLARYSMSLRTLGKTVRSAKKEFQMLFMFILIAVFVFSNFLYQLEKDDPETLFTSIPASFWWCIVTLTTVGYGDMYPKTVPGKIFGGIACVFGVLIIAFPIAILVEKFMSAYKKGMKESMLEHRSEMKRSVHKQPQKKTKVQIANV